MRVNQALNDHRVSISG